MIEIILGTPQPINCTKCKGKYGYKVTQRIQKYVDNIYDKMGNDDGCVYSDHEKVLGQMKTLACANCNTNLPFKISEE